MSSVTDLGEGFHPLIYKRELCRSSVENSAPLLGTLSSCTTCIIKDEYKRTTHFENCPPPPILPGWGSM